MSLPNLTSCDLATVMWSFRLKRAVSFMAAGPSVTIANVLFVEEGGSDANGIRNRLDAPYASVAGAYADAQDGDTILVGVGTFDGFVALSKAAVTNLTICGMGETATLLTFAAATNPVINVNNTTPMVRLAIESLTIDVEASTQPGIQVAGNFSGGASFANPGELLIQGVVVAGSTVDPKISIGNVNNVRMHNVMVPEAGNLVLDSVGYLLADNVNVSGDILEMQLATETNPPSGGVIGSLWTATQADTFTSSGEAKTTLESTVRVHDLVGLHADTATDPTTGFLKFHGFADTASLEYNCLNGQQTDTYELVGCTITGNVSIKRVLAGTGTDRIAINAQEITLLEEGRNDVEIDTYVDLDIRGGFFHQVALTNGGQTFPDPAWGTFDRDVHGYSDVVACDAGGQNVLIAPPLPNGGYAVIVEAGGPNILPAYTSNKEGYSFTVTHSSQAQENLELTIVRRRIDFVIP